MRGYKSIIQEAELLAMSPKAVSEFLKRRAKQSIDEQDHDPVDEKAEEALHGRSSPLIDLALARYARFMETVRPIFQSSQSCSAIRLAVLSNTAVSENIFTPFPVGLFGDRKQEAQEQAAAWLTAYLKNGGTLEKAAAMANHASTRTTQLYDRRHDEMSLDEVERIVI
jgi:predicted transcriptional regulator